MGKFKPSKYQNAVFRFIKAKRPKKRHGIIQAVAGSGKSTTLEEALRFIPSDQTVLMMAFNRHIAEDMKKRNLPDNVTVKTCNGYGHGQVTRNNWKAKLDKFKCPNLIKSVLKDDAFKNGVLAGLTRLIGLSKACLVPIHSGLEPFEEVLRNYPIDAEAVSLETILHNAPYIYDSLMLTTDTFDFDDQVAFPVLHEMECKQYDWVFVDEAQDLTQAQVALTMKACKPGGRIVAVGDRSQAIYGFRGADMRSMDKILEMLDAKEMPLSICYRCPKSVVREAQTLVPNMEVNPKADEGEVRSIPYSAMVNEVKVGDLVLCRTTAPVVSLTLQLIRNGVKAILIGRDVGTMLSNFINKMVKRSHAEDVPDLLEAIRDYANTEIEKLARLDKEAQIQTLEDKVDTIEALADGEVTIEGIHDRIEVIFGDEDSPGVRLSTVHKAKGLEAPNVYIIKPELMPLQFVPKGTDAYQQELNLKYVAITRAQETLTWVRG